jgi:hypothetical protein
MKATVYCFYACKEIKSRSKAGILAIEIKVTWTAWSKTKKDLRKTIREN